MTTADEAGDRMAGVLLGTALGDALGLPMEGMGGAAVQRRFPRIEGFALLGSTGFCSDDTEQSALVAQSLARHPGDRAAAVRAFRRAILGWFLRLPWGIGRVPGAQSSWWVPAEAPGWQGATRAQAVVL